MIHAEVHKYMLVDGTCQRYTVSTGTHFIFYVFQLEKTFKTTFSSFVLHMGLVSRHLKEEGNGGVKFGQYIYTSWSIGINVLNLLKFQIILVITLTIRIKSL
ncbi:ubiquinol-cytochrome C chaperone family protein [Zea mays]|uniref:Ubiquinol-cytochrome C chaperone family protein n=1 Tax=Zea mays TaxID=4577 RepID=A0A1D6GBL2_MAIZE|nr:ubiquinol-cytochrome C chaperone family protein [Zea mays]